MSKPVCAVDFDGTLCKTNFKEPYIPKTDIQGIPDDKIVNIVKAMKKEGWVIVIHSSRCWSDYNWVKSWLEKNKIPFDDIVLGKFKADCYLDDKALNLRGEI